MRLLLSPLLASIALLSTLSMPAQASQQLAQSKACLACHNIDKKVVGPSFKEIAKKYAGKKGIEAQLATKVTKGGGGVWGTMPMPANPQVSEAEAKQLVKWILTLK